MLSSDRHGSRSHVAYLKVSHPRWNCFTRRALGFVLSIVIGTVSTGQSSGQETLTLQGPAPRLSFEDDDGTTQIWDLIGDDTGFDLFDSIAGTNPVHIEPGAFDNSLAITASGNVGVGTGTPGALFHVQKFAQAGAAEVLARFSVADDSVGRLTINNNSSTNGIFHPRIQGLATSQATPLTLEGIIGTDVGGNPALSFNVARSIGGAVAVRPIIAFRNNGTIRASIAANGDMTATSFNPSSSRAIKDNIVDLDSSKASDALRQLTPVEYIYKDDTSGEKRVGFIAEDVPEIVSTSDRKSVPIMDVVALLTRVVKDQQQTVEDQKKSLELQRKSIADQQETIDTLMQRLNHLESRMQDAK
jgi:hypothetical protein